MTTAASIAWMFVTDLDKRLTGRIDDLILCEEIRHNDLKG